MEETAHLLTVDQLLDNLGASSVELSPADRRRLTEVSAPGIPPYPYGMIRNACGYGVWDELGTVSPSASA